MVFLFIHQSGPHFFSLSLQIIPVCVNISLIFFFIYFFFSQTRSRQNYHKMQILDNSFSCLKLFVFKFPAFSKVHWEEKGIIGMIRNFIVFLCFFNTVIHLKLMLEMTLYKLINSSWATNSFTAELKDSFFPVYSRWNQYILADMYLFLLADGCHPDFVMRVPCYAPALLSAFIGAIKPFRVTFFY